MQPIHLHFHNPVSRNQVTTKMYALSEEDMPKGTGLPQDLLEIVRYLDPENSPRYEKSKVMCHLFAYDFCYLAGAYLPRVWYSDVINPNPEKVFPMDSRGLFNWLANFGGEFGWKLVADLQQAQELADVGHVVTIVALSKNINHAGQMTMVIPHSKEFCLKEGLKRTPCQATSGKKYFRTECYKGDKYREYKIYVNFLK